MVAVKSKSRGKTKDRAARINRAQTAIQKILDEEGVVITANKIRVIFVDDKGNRSGGDEILCSTFAKLVGLPNTILLPAVSLEVRQEQKNGQ